MNEDKLKKALKDYNKNPTATTVHEELRRQLDNYTVIARRPDGLVDVDETMENLAFALQTEETAIAGCITVDALLAKPTPKIEADVVDGRPLRKGRTVTEPIVDWSGVPTARRRVAAYACLISQLPHSTAPCQSENIIEELQGVKVTMPAPWPRLVSKFEGLVEAAAKGDKSARDVVEAVDAMLWFKKGEAVVEATAPQPRQQVGNVVVVSSVESGSVRYLIDRLCVTESDLEALALDFFPHVKRQWSSGMTRTAKVTLLLSYASKDDVMQALRSAYPHKFTLVPASTPSLDIFFVAHHDDRVATSELMLQCRVTTKAILSSLDCPAGQDRRAWLSGRCVATRVVVVVLSANLLNDDVAMSLVQQAATSGQRVVPFVARACAWQHVANLGGKKPLPQDEYAAAVELTRILRS